MKVKRLSLLAAVLVVLVFSAGFAWAGMAALQDEAAGALKQAMAKLDNPTDTQNMVCLTNAGYAMIDGEGTLDL